MEDAPLINNRILATLFVSRLISDFYIQDALVSTAEGIDTLISGVEHDITAALPALNLIEFNDDSAIYEPFRGDSAQRLAIFVLGGLAIRGHLGRVAYTGYTTTERVDYMEGLNDIAEQLIHIIRASTVFYCFP